MADLATVSLGPDAETALQIERGFLSLVNQLSEKGLVTEAWKLLPRHLTAGEYLDPYLALIKFSRKMRAYKMEEVLSDMLEFALGNASIDGFYSYDEMCQIRAKLMSLIEACYLMYERKKMMQQKLQVA